MSEFAKTFVRFILIIPNFQDEIPKKSTLDSKIQIINF